MPPAVAYAAKGRLKRVRIWLSDNMDLCIALWCRNGRHSGTLWYSSEVPINKLFYVPVHPSASRGHRDVMSGDVHAGRGDSHWIARSICMFADLPCSLHEAVRALLRWCWWGSVHQTAPTVRSSPGTPSHSLSRTWHSAGRRVIGYRTGGPPPRVGVDSDMGFACGE
jgi:hypothetical protein